MAIPDYAEITNFDLLMAKTTFDITNKGLQAFGLWLGVAGKAVNGSKDVKGVPIMCNSRTIPRSLARCPCLDKPPERSLCDYSLVLLA